MKIDKQKQLVIWAAGCAEHALPCFERIYPKDARPRNAIKAARDWVHNRIKVSEARTAALASHAAARKARDPSAVAAARAAGHAAATAHVAGHALAAAEYAADAVGVAAWVKEREWQRKRIPKTLTRFIFKR